MHVRLVPEADIETLAAFCMTEPQRPNRTQSDAETAEALMSNRLVDPSKPSRAHRGAAPIVSDGIVRERSRVDLIEGFLGLAAVIVFACLGRIGDLLEALEKRERDH